MSTYLFDVRLSTSLRVTAPSETEARRMLTEALDYITVNYGKLETGEPLVGKTLGVIEGYCYVLKEKADA